MSARLVVRTLAAAALLLVAARPAAAQLQLGLRMDPVSSMQWAGARLWVEGQQRTALATTAGAIRDVWPGPRRGAFGVYTERGVGVLLGQDVVLGGLLPAATSVVRSSRYDAMWVLRRSGEQATIRQRLAGGAERDLATERGVVDFDVDVKGRLVLLVKGDTLALRPDGAARLAVPLPKSMAGATRVFVDAESEEIAVYAKGRLGRLDVVRGAWTFEPVSEEKEALVRQAWSRRMMVEPRFR